MAKQLDQQIRPSHDEISRRAYELFEKSGRIPGKDVENWLKAEQQLMADRRTPATDVKPKQVEVRSGSNANGLARTATSRQAVARTKEGQYA